MNIIVKPKNDSICYCRPDTTWERESKDFYSPDCVNALYWSPVIYSRICKAGKCVTEKFSKRYYESMGCGILLYGMIDGRLVSCIDHTSILPSQLFENVENECLSVTSIKNKEEAVLYKKELTETERIISEAVCGASALTSLRIGDFIVVELEEPALLTDKDGAHLLIKASIKDRTLFETQIMF